MRVITKWLSSFRLCNIHLIWLQDYSQVYDQWNWLLCTITYCAKFWFYALEVVDIPNPRSSWNAYVIIMVPWRSHQYELLRIWRYEQVVDLLYTEFLDRCITLLVLLTEHIMIEYWWTLIILSTGNALPDNSELPYFGQLYSLDSAEAHPLRAKNKANWELNPLLLAQLDALLLQVRYLTINQQESFDNTFCTD